MKIQSSALRKASARIEALELRSMFSGEIDHAIGASGLVNIHDASGAAVVGSAITVQADGKTVVAGHLDKSPNTAVITRYNTNGSLDTTFGTNGYATVANVKAYNIDNVTVLSNGKIFVGGQTYLRLTSAGKLDTTFSGDGIAPSVLAADRKAGDAVQADGSYFELQYTFPDDGKINHDRLYKFKADGTPDSSFGNGGSFDLGTLGNVNAGGVVVDSSGRVFVSFQTGNTGGDSQWAVARLTAAGKLDATYGVGGVAKDQPDYSTLNHGITLLKDGRVAVIGEGNTEHASTNDVEIFSADGKSVRGLPLSSSGGLFFATKVAQAPDGSLYVGGRHNEGLDEEGGFLGQNFAAVEHFKADLSLDTGYSPDKDAVGGFRLAPFNTGTTTADFAITASGEVALLGRSSVGTGNVSEFVRLTAAGTSNHTYTSISGSVLTINGSAANDHIVAYHVGDGDPDNTGYYQTVVRFDDDGALMSADATYYADQGGTQSDLYAAFSKIVVNLGDGDDVFDGSGLVGVPVLVHGNNGNDKIIGTTLADSLYGDAGTDTIVGNGGGDTIVS